MPQSLIEVRFYILSRRGSPAASLMRRVVLSCTGWSPDTSCTIVATVRDVKGVGISFVTSYKFGKKVGAESVTPGPSTSTVEDDDCVITDKASESPLKFYPFTIDWQQRTCQQLVSNIIHSLE